MSYIGQNPVFGDFPYQTLIGDGTASYTLNFNVSNENGLLVFLNGAIQVPGENYTAGGTSLQFADNVPIGTQIFAYGMGLPKSMLSTSAGAIGLNELAAGVYANSAEARSFINDTKMITPKTLADAFTGSNQSFSASGYQKLPGGLIVQWGVTTAGTETLLPISFPSRKAYCSAIHIGNDKGVNVIVDSNYSAGVLNAVRFLDSYSTSTPGVILFWIAIGY